MWATLALMTALDLAPAQTGQLELKNAHTTYGILGQERKDTNYLPGDMLVLAFDIEGLTVGKDDRLKYSKGLEVTGPDPKTGRPKVWFKQDPQELETVNTLGGSRRPEFALTEIGHDTPPGEYTMKVVVTDMVANKSEKLERTFTVKKQEFGIVRVGFTYLELNEGRGGQGGGLAPPVGVPGQALMLNFAATGFVMKGPEASQEQPDLAVSMQILDESGMPVLKSPITGQTKRIDQEVFRRLKFNPFQFPIYLNRTGKFKIVIKATDKLADKKAELTLDLKVVDVK